MRAAIRVENGLLAAISDGNLTNDRLIVPSARCAIHDLGAIHVSEMAMNNALKWSFF
jgi:hypothetical protein